MGHIIQCKHCKCRVPGNPHIKNQQYCNKKPCQRARKTKWQAEKIKTDSEYKAHQDEAKAEWRRKNPGYWKQYRKANPDYCKQNVGQQKIRDQKRLDRAAKRDGPDVVQKGLDSPMLKNEVNSRFYTDPGVDLAKMDASSRLINIKPGIYIILPETCDLAKMDASNNKFILIPNIYVDLAKMDSIDRQKNSPYPDAIFNNPILSKEGYDED